jgi:hypothetical protein
MVGARTENNIEPAGNRKGLWSPDAEGSNDNATVEQILRQVGKRRIRYGEILVSGRAGEGFLVPRTALRSRLQVADERRARRPEAGVSFVPA